MPRTLDPTEIFCGRLLLTVPHMDDGVLACGGTLARLPEKERIHVVYATDGMASPAPVLPWRDSISPDLGRVRTEEARAALEHLGIPEHNVHFLDLPDGRLTRHRGELSRALAVLIARIEPDHVLTPFRYDRHPDHLALNRAVARVLCETGSTAELLEYFVYYRWRLLPGGDVRAFIRPELLFEVDVGPVSARKRAVLDLFRSQTTKFYPWQTRPNLTPELLDDVSRTPECFLRFDSSLPGAAVFVRWVPWIRLVHRLEPLLKKRKDQAVALLRRLTPGGG